ncbi:MAG: hypothetical protein JWN95_541 [Frankiales bacterium]|nr:hypothetical protein [Frankiales bacterium]
MRTMTKEPLTPAYEAQVLRDALGKARFLHLSESQVRRIARVTARNKPAKSA